MLSAFFICTAVAVWDGDGPIHCAEGPKIRLSGIAAREIDETCKIGHPCPTASGKAARDHLVSLLGGPIGRKPTGHITITPIRLTCNSVGQSRGRTVAWCKLPNGRDLSCEMARSGKVLKWDRYWRGHSCSR